jgi:4-oxalocrotonate tautomerase
MNDENSTNYRHTKQSRYFYDGKEIKMPIVQISLFPGRTPEKKEELIRNVTTAIADTLRIPKERVHIILNEVPKENIGHGGVPISKTDQ